MTEDRDDKKQCDRKILENLQIYETRLSRIKTMQRKDRKGYIDASCDVLDVMCTP